MAQCPNCLKFVGANSQFCSACGSRLAPAAANASPTPSSQSPAPDHGHGRDQGYGQPHGYAQPQPQGYQQPGHAQPHGYGQPQPQGYQPPGHAQPPGYAPPQRYSQPQGANPNQPYAPPKPFSPGLGGALGSLNSSIYKQPVPANAIPPEARAGAMVHQLTSFPVAAVVLLHYLTLGIFSMIYMGLHHDKLAFVAHDDPTAAKAIGFLFIPFFNLYWIFFFWLRLSDRLNLQFSLRGRPMRAPRGLATATCIVMVIPYINFLFGFFIMIPICAAMMQSSVNELVRADRL